MENKLVKCGKLSISNTSPFTLIAGPCQLENEKHALNVAIELKKITDKLSIGLIYKTSFDKANRTSLKGQRGAGIEKSLPVFDRIRKDLGIPVLTDVHTPDQCAVVSKHVDVLQIPAFLCRQTDLLVAAAKTGKIINVKKGQFLAPWDMVNVTKKIVLYLNQLKNVKLKDDTQLLELILIKFGNLIKKKSTLLRIIKKK